MENSPTLLSVIVVRFLVWFQESSWYRIKRAFLRLSCVLIVVVGVAAPQFLLGALAASLTFHDSLPLKAGSILAALFYGRAIVRVARRLLQKLYRPNQYSFQGIPVNELAAYLLESGRFTREEAMRRLGLSQPRHKKMADTLEAAGVLRRGECNALELRPISRDQLVRQLRDNFPLAFDSSRSVWVDRRGDRREAQKTPLDGLAHSPFVSRLVTADAAV